MHGVGEAGCRLSLHLGLSTPPSQGLACPVTYLLGPQAFVGRASTGNRLLFPVRARATRALFSVQLLARVVVSGVCLVISLGSEFLYLINSCARDFVQFRCKRQLRGFLRCPLLGEGGPLVGSSVSPPSCYNIVIFTPCVEFHLHVLLDSDMLTLLIFSFVCTFGALDRD